MDNHKITEDEVLSILPPWDCFLRRYVHFAKECMDTHVVLHLVGGLGILSQTVPRSFAFPMPAGPMATHIYGLCVAKSGDRKSESLKLAKGLMKEAGLRTLGETPGSRERLIDSLADNPQQLITYPEFGAFLAAAERGYLMPLKAAFTEIWDGTTVGRDTVTKQLSGTRKKKKVDDAPVEFVPNNSKKNAEDPRLTLLCASTLEYLERHTDIADWTGGFMARFLTFYATRERSWSMAPGQPHMRPTLIEHIQFLYGRSQFDVGREALGQCLGFTPAARQLYDTWYQGIERGERGGEEIAGAITRAPAHALRVAMLIAWDQNIWGAAGDWYLDAPPLKVAIDIIDLHVRSLRRVGANLAGSKDMRDRRTILSTIKDVPTPLGVILSEGKILKDRTVKILDHLQEEGLIEMIADPTLLGSHFQRKYNHSTVKAQPDAQFPNVVPLFPGGSPAVAASGAPTVFVIDDVGED